MIRPIDLTNVSSIFDDMTDRLNDEYSHFITQKCPVCNSFGTLQFGKKICHGCGGRGYIVIDNRTGLPVDIKKNEQDNI